MGKRKQEIPRRITANEESSVSKLEKIVKKLRGNDDLKSSLAKTSSEFVQRKETWESPSKPNLSNTKLWPNSPRKTEPLNMVSLNFPHTSSDQQPLDLRLHKSFSNNDNKQPALMTTATRPVTTLDFSTRETPSKTSSFFCSISDKEKDTEPINVMGSFQELSAKLEQYFATGIAAAKFPRKMVRGQDMWIQDVEQKRRILKCLKCGHSYNSLSELSAHIKTSGHYDNIMAVPDATSLRHCSKTPTIHTSVMKSDQVKRENSAPIEQRIQATKPPRSDFSQQLGLNKMEKSSSSRLFRISAEPRIISVDQGQDGLLGRPSAFTPVMRKNESLHSSKLHSSTLMVLQKDTTVFKKPTKITAKPVGSTAEESSADIMPSAKANRTDDGTGSLKIESATEEKFPVIEPSPLCALKRFLDFGIPRLRPNIIDGGRI